MTINQNKHTIYLNKKFNISDLEKLIDINIYLYLI